MALNTLKERKKDKLKWMRYTILNIIYWKVRCETMHHHMTSKEIVKINKSKGGLFFTSFIVFSTQIRTKKNMYICKLKKYLYM
jgi:hypothetical protein